MFTTTQRLAAARRKRCRHGSATGNARLERGSGHAAAIAIPSALGRIYLACAAFETLRGNAAACRGAADNSHTTAEPEWRPRLLQQRQRQHLRRRPLAQK